MQMRRDRKCLVKESEQLCAVCCFYKPQCFWRASSSSALRSALPGFAHLWRTLPHQDACSRCSCPSAAAKTTSYNSKSKTNTSCAMWWMNIEYYFLSSNKNNKRWIFLKTFKPEHNTALTRSTSIQDAYIQRPGSISFWDFTFANVSEAHMLTKETESFFLTRRGRHFEDRRMVITAEDLQRPVRVLIDQHQSITEIGNAWSIWGRCTYIVLHEIKLWILNLQRECFDAQHRQTVIKGLQLSGLAS